MRTLKTLILVPAVLFAVACGRDDGQAVDAALDNDLRLAGQAYTPNMDSISALERQDAQTALTATQPRETAAAPRRTTTRRTAARTSSGTRTTSGTATRAPQPVVVTRKNTGRDAAIGATAGAILGASTSRNRVKGGLIGAAIGGIAGAVIGNNVDVQRDTVYR
jgi:hypothetical protein